MPSVKGPLKEFGKLLTTKVVALAVAEDDSRIVGIVHDLIVRRVPRQDLNLATVLDVAPLSRQ